MRGVPARRSCVAPNLGHDPQIAIEQSKQDAVAAPQRPPVQARPEPARLSPTQELMGRLERRAVQWEALSDEQRFEVSAGCEL